MRYNTLSALADGFRLVRQTIVAAVSIASVLMATAVAGPSSRPNVVLIMPDDLSFDDFSYYNAQGPRTPTIDALACESVRLTDFHVSPTCAPTRAALMTGRHTNATGAWHTIKGREFLRDDEITMAEVFRANGYRTALVSKWHLGDSYPLRPKDRGFDYVASIRGGGIGQQPDFWGNTNNTPCTLFVEDRKVPLTDEDDGMPGAFSTNFFTNRAIDFMKGCAAQSVPFFLYLPYNVVHLPHDMPPDARPGIGAQMATTENLDKNVGRLLAFLHRSHLEDNTLLIFLTDNGMANARLRGGKATAYEGGHRVPCFIRWKEGGMGGGGASGREVRYLTSHIDLLPTLMDILGLHDVAARPPELQIQGRSFRSLLAADVADDDRRLWNRTLVTDNQRLEHLVKYKELCVMRDETDASGRIMRQWRLVRGGDSQPWELYDLVTDLKQETDLGSRPDLAPLVSELKAAYEAWWNEVSTRAEEYTRVVLGTDSEPRICLYSHDWHNEEGEVGVPWNQGMIAAGLKMNGFNAVRFSRPGTWRFELRRWPEEIAEETTLSSALPTPVVHGYGNGGQPSRGTALPIRSARIRIWNDSRTCADFEADVDPKADCAVFTIPDLPAGPAMIQTWFYDAAGKELGGAYYDYVEFLRP